MNPAPSRDLRILAAALGLSGTALSNKPAQAAALNNALTRLQSDRPPLVIGMGDSITQSNTDTTNQVVYPTITGNSYITGGVIKSQGALRLGRNGGIAGQQTSPILQRLSNDALRYKPQIVSIMMGTNNLSTDLLTAQAELDIESMVQQVLAAGALPILCTIPPTNTVANQGRCATINAKIGTLAAKYGVPLVDMFAVLVAVDGVSYKAGYSGDGTHPQAQAISYMADAWWAVVQPLLPARRKVYAPLDTADQNNLLANGLFGTFNATTLIPSGLNISGVQGTDNSRTVAPDPLFPAGNTWTIQKLSAAQMVVYLQSNPTGGNPASGLSFVAGDTLQFAVNLATLPTTPGNWTWNVQIGWNGISGGVNPVYQNSQEMANGRVSFEFVVPVGATGMYVNIIVSGGTGTLKVNQVSLINMSQLGLATRPLPVMATAAAATVDTSTKVALLAGNATLPVASTYAQAQFNASRDGTLVVKNTTASPVTLTPAGTETIDGAAGAYTLPAKASVTLLPQYLSWVIL